MQQFQFYKAPKSSKILFLVFFTLLYLFSGSATISAQTSGSTKNGMYLGGQKGWNFFKSKKKFKHIKNKRSRKQLKKRNVNSKHQNSRARKNLKKFNHTHSAFKKNGKVKLKNTALGRKGSLYSYKKRNRKGKFLSSKSQLNSKMTLYAGSGVIITKGNTEYKENEDIIDVYSNYKISPHLTMGVNYNKTSQFSMGADLRMFSLKSEDSTLDLKLNTLVVGVNFKYNFTPTTHTFSPYLSAGPTFSFTQFAKKEREDTVGFDQTTPPEDNVGIEIVLQNDPGFKTQVIPLYGMKVAAGFDLKLNNKLSGFVQADIDLSSARKKSIGVDYLDKNKANFIFYGLSFGVKYNLFQKSSLY